MVAVAAFNVKCLEREQVRAAMEMWRLVIIPEQKDIRQ
jgi:hypothetical protein